MARAQDHGDAATRQRIARDTQAVEATFRQAQQHCATQFQVNACLDQARAERRQALDRLRGEQLQLDDARRRQRAEERLLSQQRRQRERDAQAATAASGGGASAPVATPAREGASAPAAAMRRIRPARAASEVADAAASAGDARTAARAAAFRRRQQQVSEHARAVQARNAADDARRPPALGLPVPAAAPAASR